MTKTKTNEKRMKKLKKNVKTEKMKQHDKYHQKRTGLKMCLIIRFLLKLEDTSTGISKQIEKGKKKQMTWKGK